MAHRISALGFRLSIRFTSLAAVAMIASLGLGALPASAAPPTKPVTRAAAEAPAASEDAESTEAPASEQQQLNAAFSKLLTGATMTGSFTIDAKGDDAAAKPPREESYEISSATHLGGELWLITSRIRYGDVDATVPVPVAVKWAGKTPVITLDEVTLPGMGTFSARVLFHGDRYAGTWQHDAVGGHMFGKVTPKAE